MPSFLALLSVATQAHAQAIKVPAGFACRVVAEKMGQARHIAVTPQGGMYVRLAKPVNGHATLYLVDADGDGLLEQKAAFGDFDGTGVALDKDHLYTASNTAVYRYNLNNQGEVTNPTAPEKIVTGLVDKGQHGSKSITLDGQGHVLVAIGAPCNNCQVQDRTLGSPGQQPCGMLDSVGGIWQFGVDKPGQRLKDGRRYATGLRNVVGLSWNGQTNTLFAMMHGRDQLSYLYPKLYSEKKSATTPAECLYELPSGGNAGWPYVYYDVDLDKKMVSPEYGGDGKTESAEYLSPTVAFPAHMAPNALLFYTGTQFPERYRNGAFIAFHGSWNRSPEAQEGYYVAFQPFTNGKPSGKWEVFADGFAGPGPVMSPGKAQHRPCGLAQGPDGALYVSDDTKGTIYKITYKP